MKYYYHLKYIIGVLLYKVGLLTEFSIHYHPKYIVYWGQWYWQWKRIENARKRFEEQTNDNTSKEATL